MSSDDCLNGSLENVQKSRSDSEVISPAVNKSSSQLRRILIDDLSVCSASPGDRVWATCSGAGDSSEVIHVRFVGVNFEEDALDVCRKTEIVMFTTPALLLETESDIQLRFSTSAENFTNVPFRYVPRKQRESSLDDVRFDHLIEFATTGDPIALLTPFIPLIGKTDPEGNTALHIASRSSQSFALKLILSVLPNSTKQEVINIQNAQGLTALHCAVREGDPDAVHYLMNHGARIDLADHYGNTAVHLLSETYNESIFKEILEPSRGQSYNINQLNNEGYCPLHMAVRKLKLSLIEMLIEAGADVNLLDREKKRNALLHAVEMNDIEAIQILVEKNSDTNVEDVNGDTALSLANKNANYPAIGLLIDHGADPNRMNSKGVCLADCSDTVVQSIINGERHEIPKKDGFTAPNDLSTSRSPLFGRSHPNSAPDDDPTISRLVKRSREEILNDAQSLLDEPDERPPIQVIGPSEESDDDDQQPGPSTSSATPRSQRSDWNKKMSDSVCNLDYLTRIRVSKIFDNEGKWHQLARQLGCDHMIELITICSDGDESSPTMILLDQFEQLTDSSITRLRQAMVEMNEDEGVKLIDQRYVY
ncbi:unnamed protein product [Caenorhabditis bovis]|uniref:Death domain-containing protein n=1 Tax=Caenorhabditis bovis TaxID=2654633 RepID=A0A8S1FF00_9PELO|nr:unnamed protein product [Caenorhabditis bovis]